MKKAFEVWKIKRKYPTIPYLDIFYYGLKGYGLSYDHPEEGNPKFHLLDKRFLFSVATLIPSFDSPYRLKGRRLILNKEAPPFRAKYIGRIKRPLGYFYFRGIQEWIPTLDSKTILSVNFNPLCSGCIFCSRKGYEGWKNLKNLKGDKGIEILKKKGIKFSETDQITIVTGLFKNEGETVKHIKDTIEAAKRYGFEGGVLYIGSQIKTSRSLKELLDSIGESSFKYAYTLETFTKREWMKKEKRESLEKAIDTIYHLRENGIENLEYSYIPGVDPLEKFFKNSKKLSNVAKPHISIFRPATNSQKNLACEEFIKEPVSYLCKMRLEYEQLYGGPLYANNLANLWPFPISRINPLFLTEKIKLEDEKI